MKDHNIKAFIEGIHQHALFNMKISLMKIESDIRRAEMTAKFDKEKRDRQQREYNLQMSRFNEGVVL